MCLTLRIQRRITRSRWAAPQVEGPGSTAREQRVGNSGTWKLRGGSGRWGKTRKALAGFPGTVQLEGLLSDREGKAKLGSASFAPFPHNKGIWRASRHGRTRGRPRKGRTKRATVGGSGSAPVTRRRNAACRGPGRGATRLKVGARRRSRNGCQGEAVSQRPNGIGQPDKPQSP